MVYRSRSLHEHASLMHDARNAKSNSATGVDRVLSCFAQLREGDKVTATVASMQENQGTFELRVAPVSILDVRLKQTHACSMTERPACTPAPAL